MKKNKLEFSKLILLLLIGVFISIVIVGLYIAIIVDYNIYNVICTFAAPQITVGIGYYIWKAKNENVIKINKK